MSAGSSCALLSDVQLAVDTKWADNSTQKDYVAKVGALKAVLAHQTVQVAELQDPTKDKTIKLYNTQNCGITVASCTDECTISGSEPETDCFTLAIDQCKVAGFSINEKSFRTIAPSIEEAIAKSTLSTMKAIDEEVAKAIVNKLNANKGVNGYTGGKGTVAGFTTSINAAYWNANLFSYFDLTSEVNKFSAPYLLSGTVLREAYSQTMWNAGNADGKGAKAMFDSMPIEFDVVNIDAQLSPEKSVFMIDGSAIAFFPKNYYKIPAGSPEADRWGGAGSQVGSKYQVESKNIPGMFYDVTHKITCSANVILHTFEFRLNYGIFINPTGCTPTNKGILKFLCA